MPKLALAVCSFAVNGALYGSLLSRFAEIADRADAGEAAFGLALGAGAVGGLLGSVLAPGLVRRLGTAGAVTATGCTYAVLAAAVAGSPGLVLLAAALFVLGVVDGGHDVSMNALAAGIRRRDGTPVMGRVHAVWSLALSAGAGVGAVAAAVRVPVAVHVTAVALVALVVQFAPWWRTRRHPATAAPAAPGPVAGSGAERTTGPAAGTAAEPAAAAPQGLRHARPALLVLAAAAVAASYVESPGQEWSAVLLSRGFDAGAGLAAAGPLAFSAGLLTTRLLLDPLTRRLGTRVISATAATTITASMLGGLLTAATGGPTWLALTALALAGAGAGPVFPLLFGTAGTLATRHDMAPAVTAALISTCSRTGAITAPVAVGALTGATTLAAVLAVMAAGGAVLLVTLPRSHSPGRTPSAPSPPAPSENPAA